MGSQGLKNWNNFLLILSSEVLLDLRNRAHIPDIIGETEYVLKGGSKHSVSDSVLVSFTDHLNSASSGYNGLCDGKRLSVVGASHFEVREVDERLFDLELGLEFLPGLHAWRIDLSDIEGKISNEPS